MSIRSRLVSAGYDVYLSAALSAFSRYPIGTNVFQREWDVLVLLDTCRVDALREVAPEYDFLSDIDAMTSVGSTSSEWIACTFVDEYREEVAETIYVSANGFDEPILCQGMLPGHDRRFAWTNWSTLSERDLLKLDQVWKYAPKPEHGHVRPRHVTDRAITHARDHEPDRLVVHYSQPHEPYVANADAEGRGELYDYEKRPWTYLQNGGDFETVWAAYLDNLRLVLDEVSVLIQSIDAEEVAISADHGEAFGEWGINRHPMAIPHPKIKRVPWATTVAKDTGEYEPTLEERDQSRDVEGHLENLGYLS
ncbi:hypothetical protein [Natronosalvus halobius]|uniref:hypothetical protein n=1 Tax=Natronosalvus halobius TaxID=2953746 RepID=UPI00209DDE1F|nr:hypothetical protein [Natronosalvus halobius]USZ71457.1 hypothetical protein NGM15_15515 [Natronosalvus halobius]